MSFVLSFPNLVKSSHTMMPPSLNFGCFAKPEEMNCRVGAQGNSFEKVKVVKFMEKPLKLNDP